MPTSKVVESSPITEHMVQRMRNGMRAVAERVRAHLEQWWAKEATSGQYRLLTIAPKRWKDEAIFHALKNYLDGVWGLEMLHRALELGSDGRDVLVEMDGQKADLSTYLLLRSLGLEGKDRERWENAFYLLANGGLFAYSREMESLELPPWVRKILQEHLQYGAGGKKVTGHGV